MAQALAERLVRCTTSDAGCCPKCVTQAGRVVERNRQPTRPGVDVKYLPKSDGDEVTAEANGSNRPNVVGNRDPRRHVTKTRTVGWAAGCGCGVAVGAYVPSLVIDPFAGSGTTLAEAVRLGRRAAGCDLNAAYVALAEKRIADLPAGVAAADDDFKENGAGKRIW